jgi:hypothetical protein
MSKKLRLAAGAALLAMAISTAGCADITAPNDGPEPAANTQGGDV